MSDIQEILRNFSIWSQVEVSGSSVEKLKEVRTRELYHKRLNT